MKKRLFCLLLSLLMLATMLPVSAIAETPTQEPPAAADPVAEPEADPKNDPADEPQDDPAPAADPIQVTVGEEQKKEEGQENQQGDPQAVPSVDPAANEDPKEEQKEAPDLLQEEQEKEQEEEQQDGQLQEEGKEEEPEEQKEEGKEEEPEEQKEEADALKEEEKEEEQQTDAPAAYTVVFAVNGDTVVVTVPAGERIGGSMPAEPDLGDAYIFEGWFDENGNWVDAWTEVNAPMTVTARFMYLPAGSDSASAGGITVTAAWNAGVFPEGTRLTVDPRGRDKALAMAENALPEGYEAVDGEAVDITFIADGVSVQPYYGSVSVSISLSRALEGESFRVLHEGAPRRMMMKAAKAGGGNGSNIETVSASASATGAAFSGSGFSVYAIVGETYQDTPVQVPRATYEFYVDGSKVDSQIVKDGDLLTEPSVPDCAANQVFKGWKVQGETGYIDFTAAVTVTGTTDVTVHVDADFATEYKVIFYKNTEKTAIFAQETAESGTDVSTAAHKLANTDTSRFVGWYLATDTEKNLVTSVTLNDADIELLPLFAEGLWAYFDSRGGSNVEPVFTTTNSVAEPAAPTRAGYAFQGWYTSEEAAQNLMATAKVTFPLTVTQSQTMYAGWQAIQVPYTLLIWAENEDDNGFTIYSTIETRQALTGTVLETALYENDSSIFPKYANIPCFFLDTELTDQAVCSVKGDGTSVRNVYFRRYRFTLGFYQNGQLMFKLEDIKYREYFYDDLLELMDNYSGEIIGNSWMRSWLDTHCFIDGIHAARYLRCEAWEFGLSVWNSVFSKYKNNNGIIRWDRATAAVCTNTFNEYHEWLDDATTPEGAEDAEINGIRYYNVHSSGLYMKKDCMFEVSRPGFSFTKAYRNNKQIDIGTTGPDSWYVWHTRGGAAYDFYFIRKEYTLSFDEPGVSDYTLKYEELITDCNPIEYIIDQKEKIDGLKIYKFKGWYDNEMCLGQPVDFSTTRMPAGDLLLYAKWEVVSFPVTFDPANGDDPWTVTVESGDTVDKPTDPTKEGMVFVGWKKEDGTLFNFNTAIEHEMTLTAVYQGTDATYTVAYDPGDYGTFTKTDDNAYLNGATAVVLGAPTVTNDTKVFTGWRVGPPTRANALKLPGESFEIDADKAENGVITLYAQYADLPGLLSLTYEPNGGQGTAYTIDDVGANNEDVEVKAPSAVGISPQSGYVFLYWTTAASGGVKYYPGERIALDSNGTNALYAQYAAEVTVTVTGSTKTVKYDGTEQKNTKYTVTYKVAGQTVTSLPDGVTAQITPDPVEAKGTDADTYTATVSVTLSSTSALYTVPADAAEADVVLIVEPRTVTLTSETAEKVYDGTALTRPTVTVGGDGFVPDEVNSVNATGTVTYVTEGEVTNAITYTEGPTFKAQNYTITKTEGKLKITPAPLTITVKDQTYTYNGKAQGESNATYTSDFDKKVTVSGLVGGDKLTGVTLDGSEKKAGVYADRIKASGAAVGDLTANYTITYVPGKLTIKAKDDTPATGDTTNMILWASLMLTSALGCAGALLLAPRKRRTWR